MKQLGTITKVDLRDIWKSEPRNFSKWLASDEGLMLLSDAVDMTLELKETESSVGSFSVDIYAVDTASGSKVIIENQLEDTDHGHLGKIITYAAGKNAQAVIWVVKHARDEHRQAIEWLNGHTDDEVAFFLVEIEVWRIGDSLPAPVFNVVERPNEWARAEKAKDGLTESQVNRLEYWRAFREASHAHAGFSASMKARKATSDHWTDVIIGISGLHLCEHFLWQRDQVGVEICIPDDKALAAKVLAHKADFETLLNVKGTEYGEGKKSSGIRFYRDSCGLKDSDNWAECIAWQLDATVKLRDKLLSLDL